MGGLVTGLSVFFLSLFYVVRFLPSHVINLPHRDYWLAPERREETFRFLFHAGIWLACFEALFLLSIHLLLVSANTASPPRLPSGIWLLAGLFLVTTGAWMFVFIRRFRRIP